MGEGAPVTAARSNEPRKPKRKVSQDSIAFCYYENLRSILSDLQHIDSLIPKESSRSSYRITGEGAAIIEHRKQNLLRMIQTICRDHMYFGAQLLAKGWTPEQHSERRKMPEDYREWIRRNCIG
jgi:hypothetical protein